MSVSPSQLLPVGVDVVDFRLQPGSVGGGLIVDDRLGAMQSQGRHVMTMGGPKG